MRTTSLPKQLQQNIYHWSGKWNSLVRPKNTSRGGPFSLLLPYYHRKNIEENCKGNKKTYSGSWLCDKLLGVKSQDNIDRIKRERAQYMTTKTLNYINFLEDYEQYPGVQCSQDPANLMYQHPASSTVESMNQVNKPAWDRTAVDVMLSMKLVVDLETRQFNASKGMAHSWTETWTPHDNKLQCEILGNID